MKKNKTNMQIFCTVFSIGLMVSAVLWFISLYSNRKIISITYNLAQGVKLEIQMLDVNYRLEPTGTGFSITESEEEILQGVIVDNNYFEEFKDLVGSESNIEELELLVYTNEEDEIIYMKYETYVDFDDEGSPIERYTPTTTLVKRINEETSIVYFGKVEMEEALACYDNLNYVIK